ncbi:MAG: SsrA-binding protein SmpB [Bacillota bacterium]|nr:SsrA-binding protein SmpB [Bacillota bacterium]
MKTDAVKIAADNRKARHDFFVDESLEAGIALAGTEVKSLRQGKCNLRDSYARIENGEALLYNVHISSYDPASKFNHDPLRTRKLLLHKHEILKLNSKVKEKGYALVPLKIYFRNGKAKVELGLARGKRQYDKRDDLAQRDAERAIARALRGKDQRED